MKTTDENYEPYGEEWEKEVMKLPKRTIMEFYRRVCIKLQNQKAEMLSMESYAKEQIQELQEELEELRKIYSEACDAAGAQQERAIEAERDVRESRRETWYDPLG